MFETARRSGSADAGRAGVLSTATRLVYGLTGPCSSATSSTSLRISFSSVPSTRLSMSASILRRAQSAATPGSEPKSRQRARPLRAGDPAERLDLERAAARGSSR
jgi:hypothetical protein